MTKKRNNGGFTLAEMLIVVAIIIILMGVAFVAVQNHQRSMTRLEFDGIAKEIFFAAQNHLTEAQSQGYLDISSNQLGEPGKVASDKEEDIYYILSSNDHLKIKELMLPRYAIVPSGSYIIRYQLSSAKVLDVFYSVPGRSSMLTVSGTTLGSGYFSYENLMSECRGEEKASTRQNYHNAVVGWYGGEDAVPFGARLKAPTFDVINEKTLHVEISDDSDNASIPHIVKLIVTGKTSGAEAYFPLWGAAVNENSGRTIKNADDSYSVLLDSVTESGKHFAEIISNNSKHFIPGEDLTVKVVTFSTETLANVAMSAEKVTNSLFADPYPYKENEPVRGSSFDKDHVVGIANCRHLENLDSAVSKLIENSTEVDVELEVEKAFQTDDLDWDGYGKAYALSGSTEAYWPVTPSYSSNGVTQKSSLEYDGQGHSVSNIKVEHNGDSGLFGTLTSGSAVNNLELIDFDITGTTSAGALVGTANGTEITNVVAHNSETKDSTFNNSGDSAKPNVTATSAAGGLIGSMSGGSVTKSAAAVYVKCGTDAGGLIGSAASGTVTACYSGGHTYSGTPTGATQKYDDTHKDVYPVRYYDADNNPMYNVTATGGTAGGLIGSAGAATISNSYSTCSASGTTAGGFVGTGGSSENCYCTGLVSGVADEGAFAGKSAVVEDCQFFEIINERSNTDSSGKPAGYDYLKPIGDVTADMTTGITALDASADTYNSFSGTPANWKEAIPYDAGGTDTFGLKVYYKKTDGKTGYNLQTVEQLSGGDGSLKTSAGDTTDYFVATHYGDWPAPEEFIFN